MGIKLAVCNQERVIMARVQYNQDIWELSAIVNNFFWTFRNSIIQKLYLEVDFLVVEYIIGRLVGFRNVFVKIGIGVEAV